MLVELSRTITMQIIIILAIINTEINSLVFTLHKILTKSIERDM